ncbi:aspartate kinase [Dysgonomonas capnocytophagoides]|uniref:aspartate kinase n=1 Tax=Dysgonomonas capnocytophagoides TaxID=45254 RepID=UPI002A80A56E|nr:aspartate kinase [Dysgonomonas capnocytophagoides]
MKVLKFGSTAIDTPERLNIVADIVSKNNKCIVIVSAISGTTSLLEEISDYLYKKNPEGANETISILEKEYQQKIEHTYKNVEIKAKATLFLKEKINYIRSFTKDLFTLFEEKIVLAQGEILSSGIVNLLLQEKGIETRELSALDFIRIDKKNEPDLSFISSSLTKILADNRSDVYVTQGYICKNAYGEVDNFHFGGSDYTASLVGAAINAEEIQIWTSFDALYGNNSQLMANTSTVHQLNFDEAAELAYFGTKILHPICILPAKMANIPVKLLNIYTPEAKGTLISNDTESGKIKAIAAKDGITVINIKSSRMLLAHGFLRKVCEIFEKHLTSIDMLTTSEVGVSVTIDNTKYLAEITDDLKKLGIVAVDKSMTIISAVGDLDWKNAGLESKVLDSVKDIPVRMISFGGSSCNISFIVKEEDKNRALEALRNTIF